MYSYSLREFGEMINDTVRMRAYYEALRRTVHPDSVVVDIGAGTGIFSLLACQLGARRVYAIDPNPWIELGEKMASANGFADRIIFIKDLSTKVNLPEQADIIISELRGAHPLVPENLPAINDARRRLLKPGGIFIPQKDLVYVSLFSEATSYQNRVVKPWGENDFQLDLSAALNLIKNTEVSNRSPITAKALFPAQLWVEIDYATRENPNASATVEWIATEACTVHYIVIWFDTVLFDDIGFSTAPGEERANLYDHRLLPLQKPLEISPNDKITLELNATLVNENYILSWNTTVQENEGWGKIKETFRQSTFFGKLLARFQKPVTLTPELSPKGQVARFTLNIMNERTGVSLDTIAALALAEFPDVFPDIHKALQQVTSIATIYGK